MKDYTNSTFYRYFRVRVPAESVVQRARVCAAMRQISTQDMFFRIFFAKPLSPGLPWPMEMPGLGRSRQSRDYF